MKQSTLESNRKCRARLPHTQPRRTRQRCICDSLRISRIWLLALLLLAIGDSFTPPAQAQDVAQSAVDRAGSFLAPASRGKAILGYLHAYATYHGHEYVKTFTVPGKRGHFDLVYRFRWSDDGVTNLAFRFDSKGNLYETYVVNTNAEWPWTQPFVAARATIRILSNALISDNKDLTATQREAAQELVKAINVEGLMDLDLELTQRSSK